MRGFCFCIYEQNKFCNASPKFQFTFYIYSVLKARCETDCKKTFACCSLVSLAQFPDSFCHDLEWLIDLLGKRCVQAGLGRYHHSEIFSRLSLQGITCSVSACQRNGISFFIYVVVCDQWFSVRNVHAVFRELETTSPKQKIVQRSLACSFA